MTLQISSDQIKELRLQTGAGFLNCKNALIESNGNFELAVTTLRKKGLASAEKKLLRTTQQGIITSYIHTGAKIGVLIELNCETDFVARRVEFQNLARSLAMQFASLPSVNYISLQDIPQQIWDAEMAVESQREDLKNKPESVLNTILKGRVEKTLKTYTLLNQACIRDPNITVEDYIKQHVSLLGENIQIGKICKFIIGEKKN
uniref:Elongation factor Ts, mitochondrial n=1 Tax=Neotessella volvocina TaxID=52559 RepID=A0A3G2R0C2_9STRA|nr:elongation factor Ts [Neotessella volvocina]